MSDAAKREHDKADRAMARVFRRLAKCQATGEVPGGGVCGKCLLAAVTSWRWYTRKKAAGPSKTAPSSEVSEENHGK